MQTIPSRSATFPYKHSTCRPCWLAATPTPFALPQMSAAAAPPATPGGGVATRPIAWGRPPPLQHPPLPSTQRPCGWQQETTAGGEEGDAGAPHRPLFARERQFMAQRLAHPPARPRGGRGRPETSGPNGRHAPMTTATRGNPPRPPLLKFPYPAPRHATLPCPASQWGGHPRGGRIGRRRRQAAPGKCSRGGGGEWLAIHGSMMLHSSTHANSTFMNHHHIQSFSIPVAFFRILCTPA